MSADTNALTSPINPLIPPGDESADLLHRRIALNMAREIVNSYHLTYDHLQEVIQNAVDACEEAYFYYQDERGGMLDENEPYVPRVSVVVDLANDAITVVDNGMGMSYASIEKYFLRPYATQKGGLGRSGRKLRGEKGVGATFLAYGSASLRVTTRAVENGEFVSGEILGGIDWVVADDPNRSWPELKPSKQPHAEIIRAPHGTAVTIGFSPATNMKQLARHGTAPRHWDAILRLFTALGYVDLDEKDAFLSKLSASVKVISTTQGEQSQVIGGGYLFPHLLPEVADIRMSDLRRGEKGPLPVSQTNKDCVWEKHSWENLQTRLTQQLESGSGWSAERKPELYAAIQKYKPECYAMFAWSSDFWQTINNIIFRTRREELQPGTVFACRGQRVGRTDDLQFSTRAGDQNRFLLLISLQDVTPDIGRKSLPQEVDLLARLIGDTLHTEFLRWDDALRPAPRRGVEAGDLQLEELLDAAIQEGADIQDAEKLGIHLLKEPREEQDVIALFFDLLGAGRLQGYACYSTHISEKYDAVTCFALNRGEGVLFEVHPILRTVVAV